MTQYSLVSCVAREPLSHKVFPYLRDHCGVTIAESTTDIAYVAGNAITKSCNPAWLTAYESAL
jgi:hypothetical protein